MFFRGSRYEKVGEHQITDGNGRVLRYKKTRFIPETQPQLGHIVTSGERLDHIAHRFFGDSERFWRVCDANLALWPDDLAKEAGRTIFIPSSED